MADALNFRLYILGRVADPRPLTTLAEFRSQRAVERVSFAAEWVTHLADRVGDLRSYVEGSSANYPPAALEALGADLFNVVIQRSVHDLLQRARGATKGRLPFELIVEDADILAWPWEYMFDDVSESFICQDFNPISRTVITPETAAVAKPTQDRLRVLVLLAVRPEDPNTLPGEQVRAIQTAFETYLSTESVSVEVRGNTDPAELGNLLHQSPCDVLHFFGHAGVDSEGGFLRYERQIDGEVQTYDQRARKFAQLLIDNPTKLVFLNACQTALGDREDSARNSVAVELMRRGVPAVIATQFKMPANRSHRFASLVYAAIASGRPLIDAMFDGRSSMEDHQADGRFVDWGIPVLYAMDPKSVLLRVPKAARKANGHGQTKQGVTLGQLPTRTARLVDAGVEAPRVLKQGRRRVAILDADANVGRLPDVIAAANAAQTYFHFELFSYDFLPGDIVSESALGHLPASPGTPAPRLNPADPLFGPQLYIPRVAPRLAGTPAGHEVDYVCCLTSHRAATIDYDGTIVPNLFVSLADTEDLVGPDAKYCVAVVSVNGLRPFAAQARVSMAKATFSLCLAALLDLANESIEFHDEVRGCLLDACHRQADIVDSLRKMVFDDPECVALVNDDAQVRAINAMLSVPDIFDVEPPSDPTADPGLDAGLLGGAQGPHRDALLNGVNVRTGGYAAAPLPVEDLAAQIRVGHGVPEAPKAPRTPARGRTYLDVRDGVDPQALHEAGWGVVFPASVDAEPLRRQLQPLLDLRQREATAKGRSHLYREYVGPKGYQQGEMKIQWLERNGTGPGMADPGAVPYYLLLVGSPEEIPFAFEQDLRTVYAVGRLCFDRLADYGHYAEAAVRAATNRVDRRAVFFGTRNPGDRPTRLSATELVGPLAQLFQNRNPAWQIETVLARDATKARLTQVMNPLAPPALIFTATHGAAFPSGDDLQPTRQGALICQEWSPLDQGEVPASSYFASDDVAANSRLAGSIVFNFACFSAGTPQEDEVPTALGQQPVRLAHRPFIAELPKRLLGLESGGPLAVIGHVDRACGLSFLWPGVDDHRIPFEDALLAIAKGSPVGYAMRGFPHRFQDLSTTLQRVAGSSGVSDPDSKVAGWWTACRDARNYVILGDPASRLSLA